MSEENPVTKAFKALENLPKAPAYLNVMDEVEREVAKLRTEEQRLTERTQYWEQSFRTAQKDIEVLRDENRLLSLKVKQLEDQIEVATHDG